MLQKTRGKIRYFDRGKSAISMPYLWGLFSSISNNSIELEFLTSFENCYTTWISEHTVNYINCNQMMLKLTSYVASYCYCSYCRYYQVFFLSHFFHHLRSWISLANMFIVRLTVVLRNIFVKDLQSQIIGWKPTVAKLRSSTNNIVHLTPQTERLCDRISNCCERWTSVCQKTSSWDDELRVRLLRGNEFHLNLQDLDNWMREDQEDLNELRDSDYSTLSRKTLDRQSRTLVVNVLYFVYKILFTE